MCLLSIFVFNNYYFFVTKYAHIPNPALRRSMPLNHNYSLFTILCSL